MEIPTYEQVIADKQLSQIQMMKEILKLDKYSKRPTNLKGSFVGNNILYHFQFEQLCRTNRNHKVSFYDMMNDTEMREKLWNQMIQYNPNGKHSPARLYEMYRFLHGAIVLFKPSVAINLYTRYRATAVLDPCAGWGGRMLGAIALGIPYTGIDTNTDLKPGYDALMAQIPSHSTMIYGSAMDQDFSTIDYDFVLTSPPYCNLELYAHMPLWEGPTEFYEGFLIPLIDRCRKHIRRDGKVCFNISPSMYAELIRRKYPTAIEEIPMCQQVRKSKVNHDLCYVWNRLE